MCGCYCRAIMAALIVLFVWWTPIGWTNWLITILATLLAIWALFWNDKCCCKACSAPVTAAKKK